MTKKRSQRSHALKRVGILSKKPTTALTAESLGAQTQFTVTEEGFMVNGQHIGLSWLPDWQQIKNIHQQVGTSHYRQLFFAVVTALNMQMANAHHYGPGGMQDCFKEKNGDGVAMIHTEDLSGIIDSFPGNMSNALFNMAECGQFILTNCTEGLLHNTTLIYNFVYSAPSLIERCVNYTLQTVGHFSISDTFDVRNILCIINKGQALLANITAQAQQQLPQDESNSHAGAIVGSLAAIGLVAAAAGYLTHYYKKHGHLPCRGTAAESSSTYQKI